MGKKIATTESSEIDPAREANGLLRAAGLITAVVGIIALVAIAAFVFTFRSAPLASDVGSWGQTGDYFGGIINPAVGLATVLLIFIGIHIQRAELKATEKQLKETAAATRIQNFENALFSWLDSYQKLIESVEDSKEQKRGRDALRHWYREKFTARIGFFNRSMRAGSVDAATYDLYLNDIKSLQPTDDVDREDIAFLESGLVSSLSRYAKLYEDEVSSLDAPLRTLYRMLKWIDDSEFGNEQKWQYVALVRAQLSWIEMVYLLFNGMTKVGEKFVKYADRYALFDNLAPGGDLNVWFSKWYHMTPEHTGVTRYYKPSAFSSSIAKQELRIRQDA